MDNELDILSIKEKYSTGHIKWSTHGLARMQEREIDPDDVENCINYGKIIEQYSNAYPYPACLILGTKKNNSIIHVVVGYGCDLVWIITAYEPDIEEWENGFSRRKR